MNDTLRRCLDDLEARLDPLEEEALLAEWARFPRTGSGATSSRPGAAAQPAGGRVAAGPINAALEDFDQMALQQYGACSARSPGARHVLNVRANYGSSIAPLLFGVEPFMMDDEFDTLPTSGRSTTWRPSAA